MSNAPAISFIVVRCADIERSRAFYEATLGVVAREEQHESRRAHRHYRGFVQNQRRFLEKEPTTKKLLYVLRTTATGTHLLLTRELERDLTPSRRQVRGGIHRKVAEAARPSAWQDQGAVQPMAAFWRDHPRPAVPTAKGTPLAIDGTGYS